jgi:hypothetical protein
VAFEAKNKSMAHAQLAVSGSIFKKGNKNFKMADRKGKHSKTSKEGGTGMSWTTWAQKYGSKVLNCKQF